MALVGTAKEAELATSCTSGVTDMSAIFNGANAFNVNIGRWDMSSVTTMKDMFKGATSFNQDVSKWNTAAVTDMSGMFNGATGFNNNGAALSWADTSKVTTMKDMFNGATSFNQDVSKLNTAAVTDMSGMFNGATGFNNNGAALSWADTSKVTTMKDMFNGATSFNQDVSNLSTAAVTDMSGMFNGATGFNNNGAALSWADTSKVTTMKDMFNGATSFNQDVSNWNTALVTDMSGMFNGATSFNRDLSSWNVANVVTDTDFDANTGVNWSLPKPAIPPSGLRFAIAANAVTVVCASVAVGDQGVVNGVTYTKRDKGGLVALVGTAKEADLATSCTSGVTDMSAMFNGASAFNVDIGRWDTSSVTTMKEMFKGALAFDKDISKWNTAAVTDMISMFNRATAFNRDLSSWSMAAILTAGGTCTNFDVNTGLTWALPKPSIPAVCIAFQPAVNGFTILCPSAAVGDTGVVNGVTYTKRDRGGLLALAGAANESDLATSCTSGVTDMSIMFSGASTFNGDIGRWDTSSVTTMKEMFKGALAFDKDISKWSTAAVTDMIGMFESATSFNGDLSSWNVGNVGATCTKFDAHAGATWVQPKPNLPATCLAFTLATNGATIICPIAAVGDQGVVNGVTYTKRDKGGLVALVGTAKEADLATSCTSGVTDMSAMFNGASAFNVDIGRWDTSSVTTMKEMFKGALAFDKDISKWSTAAVTDMSGVFNGATRFDNNGAALSWADTSKVTTMKDMFKGATTFNQDVSKWNTALVTDMIGMFESATSFNGDLSSWNVGNVGATCTKFDAHAGATWVQPKPNLPATCLAFTLATNGVTIICPIAAVGDQGVVNGVTYTKRDKGGLVALVGTAKEADLATSCTSGVTDMSAMFDGASAFNVDIGRWDTSSVMTMKEMFKGALAFDKDISKWNTAAVTDMISMFNGATSFNRDLSSWNVVNVGSTCTSFEANTGVTWALQKPALPAMCLGFTLATNGFTILCPGAGVGDTGVVNGVTYTKRDKGGLVALVGTAKEADLATSCTSGVTDMSAMFNGASAFNVDIGRWDTSSVTTMKDMFKGATSFNQDVSKWNTALVTDMISMFESATSFNRDLSSWNVASLGNTCVNFEANTRATWTLPKPALPAYCLGFTLATNGVTVLCPGAGVGDTGVVNGVTYTKRDRVGLLALVGTANGGRPGHLVHVERDRHEHHVR